MFTFSTKREIRQFHVVVVQRRQRNVPKKRRVPFSSLLETFSIDDGDSSKNVTFIKKIGVFLNFVGVIISWRPRSDLDPVYMEWGTPV